MYVSKITDLRTFWSSAWSADKLLGASLADIKKQGLKKQVILCDVPTDCSNEPEMSFFVLSMRKYASWGAAFCTGNDFCGVSSIPSLYMWANLRLRKLNSFAQYHVTKEEQGHNSDLV